MDRIAEGEELLAYAISEDGKFAEAVIFPPIKREANTALEIRLRPALTGKIVLQNIWPGEALQPEGAIDIAWGRSPIPDDGSELSTIVMCSVYCDGKQVYDVPGLLPGQTYCAHIHISRHKVFGLNPGTSSLKTWRIAENEENPVLMLLLKKEGDAPPPTPPPHIRSEQDLQNDIAAFGDVTWQKADPIETLTWYALERGIAIADTEKKEVRRITELLGERDFVPSSIAFGKDKVWLGTNKGLFAWDRKDMFWTRFAVGGKFTDLPVKGVSLSDDGKTLSLSVEQKGQTTAFEYGIDSHQWRKPD
jgi:hypothetical protein